MKQALLLILLLTSPVSCLCQKVKVGYDKAVQFSKFRTFSWSEQSHQGITLNKLILMGEVEKALAARGLQFTKEGGDLELSGLGGFGGEVAFGASPGAVPSHSTITNTSATMWHGATQHSGAMIVKGTLVLEMVDPGSGKLIWEGAVTDNLDFEKNSKSMKKMKQAIAKLVKHYPPK